MLAILASDLDILRGQLLPIANKFSDQLTVAISDEEEFEDELKSLGLDDWGEDVAMAIWASSREKYRLDEEYDRDSLRKFIEVRERERDQGIASPRGSLTTVLDEPRTMAH